MARRPATRWEVRAPHLLLGARHARRVLAAGGHSPQAWTILGHCCWSLAPDLGQGPPKLEGPWDPATGLSWSQAAACYRRALEQSARNVPALLSLARIYERASDPPSAAIQHCRVADTYLAAFALEDAEHAYRQSLAQDRSLGSGWLGLCLTLLHQGHPAKALEACRNALTCTLTGPQRGTLEKLQALLASFARD